jgi:hypothetical protein
VTPNQFTYHAWRASRLLPHGERPTAKHLRVARQLARHPHTQPSHRQLASAAGCCVRTVQNALNRFRDLGMLQWQHVYDRRMRPSDQRRQRANLYLFIGSFLFPPAKRRRALSLGTKIQNPVFLVGKLPDEARNALLVKWGLA